MGVQRTFSMTGKDYSDYLIRVRQGRYTSPVMNGYLPAALFEPMQLLVIAAHIRDQTQVLIQSQAILDTFGDDALCFVLSILDQLGLA